MSCWMYQNKKLVARPGFEPGTRGFSIRCSTNWAISPQKGTAKYTQSHPFVNCVASKHCIYPKKAVAIVYYIVSHRFLLRTFKGHIWKREPHATKYIYLSARGKVMMAPNRAPRAIQSKSKKRSKRSAKREVGNHACASPSQAVWASALQGPM